MEILLAFFTIFMFSIKNIYILNILWIIYMTYLFAMSRVKLDGKKNIIYLGIFYLWCLFSIIVYNVMFYKIQFRQILSLIFMFQYVFFDIKIYINKKLLYNWIVRWAIVLSIYILGIFIYKGYFRQLAYWEGLIRFWGRGYIPGFPTNVVVPMLFSLFLAIYLNKNIAVKLLLSLAIFIVPSRAGQLGMIIIWMYFFIKYPKKKRIIIPGMILIIVVLCFFGSRISEIVNGLFIRYRLDSNGDRESIIRVVFQLFKKSPIIGYGGNTLDTLAIIIPSSLDERFNWAHTHNWFFEMLIRYGIVGCGLFTGYLIRIVLKIKDRAKMFFVIFLLGIGLLQTYMQNFVYIFIIMSMVCLYDVKEIDKNEKNEDESFIVKKLRSKIKCLKIQ